MLARQVRPVGVAVELRRRGIDDRCAVEKLIRGEPLHGAARDVADGVAAAAGGRLAGGLEVREDVRELRELEPVELDVLAGRELAVAAAEEIRGLTDRAQLVRRELSGGHFHAQHERADLRLVVVEAPPLEPHDILLGDVFVALGDQRGELLADPERRLFALQALDRVTLENKLPVDRNGFARAHLGHCTHRGS